MNCTGFKCKGSNHLQNNTTRGMLLKDYTVMQLLYLYCATNILQINIRFFEEGQYILLVWALNQQDGMFLHLRHPCDWVMSTFHFIYWHLKITNSCFSETTPCSLSRKPCKSNGWKGSVWQSATVPITKLKALIQREDFIHTVPPSLLHRFSTKHPVILEITEWILFDFTLKVNS